MKKITILVVACALVILCLVLCACDCGCGNKQAFDTTYTFDRAIVSMPNGEVIEGRVTSWKDYTDGDTIQVKIGTTTYLTHISNVMLIAE